MYRTLLFDMDGVLLDTEKMAYRIWRKALAPYGYDLKPEQYAAICGAPPQDFDRFMNEELPIPREDLLRFWSAEVDRLSALGDIPTMPGFGELMDFLRSYPGKKAIVTSNGSWALDRYSRIFGFREVFDTIVESSMVARPKPEPDLYLHAAALLDTAPEDCLAIEDSHWGIQAALSAGIPVLHMEGIFGVPQAVRQRCLASVTSLAEVIPFAEK